MADLISMLAAASSEEAPTPPDTDPNFNQTVLLLHGDGTNGAQNNTFLDSSSNNFTITRNGNTTQGTFSPFSAPDGRWSNYFDGTGDYLTTPSDTDFEFDGAFTIECWFYSNANTNAALIDNRTITDGYLLSPRSDGTIEFGNIANSSLLNGTIVRPLNAWSHIVVCRDASNNISLFINGQRDATTTSSVTFPCPATFTIGAKALAGSSLVPINGYLSSLRVVKGTAVYDPTSTTITVPTAPLTAVSGTSLLTCQSNRFVDNSTNNFAITRNGDVKVTPFSPFAPSAAYDASVNGGSGYFDGTGDYLTAGTTSSFNFIHNQSALATIEFWIYRNSAAAEHLIFDTTNGSTANTGFYLSLTTGGALDFNVSKSSAGNWVVDSTSSGATVPLNAWTHIAVTYDYSLASANVAFYINGVSAGTANKTANAAVNTNASYALTVGATATGTNTLPAYVSSIRISNVIRSGLTSVPTAPYTNDANTSLLLNFTNAGIFDNTGKNVLETVGGAQIDTTTKKFGTGSMEFDGTGDYLQLPVSENYAFGTGDFTFECWFYIAGNSAQDNNTTRVACIFDNRGTAGTADGMSLLINGNASTTGTGLIFLIRSGGSTYTLTYTGSIAQTTWHYVAVVRSGTDVDIYLNGSSVANNASFGYQINSTNVMTIGSTRLSGYLRQLNGFIDDLRFTKGVARTITVPTQAFPNL